MESWCKLFAAVEIVMAGISGALGNNETAMLLTQYAIFFLIASKVA